MRKRFAAAVALVIATSWSAPAFARQQGAITGADPVSSRHFRVHVRDANSWELASATTSTGAGQFSFTGLRPSTYVVEMMDAAGKVIGLSRSISVADAATVVVTVGASAAGAIVGSGSGQSLLGLGPLASVAIAEPAATAAVSAVLATRDGKLVVCHKPGSAAHTLEINASERSNHLGHGDSLGACPASPTR